MYYVAYGSNMNVDQMKVRCPEAKAVGTTFLEGYRLLFRGNLGFAYLTVEKQEGYKVPLVVWDVSEKDINNLDHYEGYPDFYRKETMKFVVSGKEIEAFIYMMNDRYDLAIPSYSYYQGCLEGYESFGLDTDYLKQAYDCSRLKQN